ncbi:MAG: signal peptidase II [Tissierellia bacterium]|nr:signal peptidase II [Tissierellia bacterium]
MIYILIILIGLVLDRLTKLYAINNFIDNPIDLGWIKLTYLENRGAAFGILQNKRTIFIILTVTIVFLICIYFIKNIKYNSKLINISIAFIISGALGNFYDRVINHYVVDFIDVNFNGKFNFPVFNVADIFVTVGCIFLMFLILGDKDVSKNRK